jgi:sodium-dependent dicarboxylate transporter 2/3/5
MEQAPFRRPALWIAIGLYVALRLLPPPGALTEPAWAVAALLLLMAFLWVSEAIPIYATALLPFLLLPLAGVMGPAEVAAEYWSPTIFLLLGGAMVAVAIEKHGLHRRLALALVARAPARLHGLLLAIMAATAILSMLVSNTSTALVMMPVALGLLVALGPTLGVQQDRAAIVLVLGIAWAASIGGLGTLIGSPTNAIAADLLRRSLGLDIDFLTWALFGLPLVALAIPLSARLLTTLFAIPNLVLDRAAVGAAVHDGGPLSPDQRRLLPLLLLTIAAFILLPIIGPALGLPRIDDGMIAVAAALALLILPAASGGALLQWADTKMVPWDIMLLFGGGLALAAAMTESGLAAGLGTLLSGAADLPILLVAALVVAVIILVTEFASNVATAAGFIPVIAAVAAATGADPLLLAMPAAMAASWGFMMPAGTGPNAIAYATGRVTIPQMVKSGALLDLLGIPLIVGTCFAVAALL